MAAWRSFDVRSERAHAYATTRSRRMSGAVSTSARNSVPPSAAVILGVIGFLEAGVM